QPGSRNSVPRLRAFNLREKDSPDVRWGGMGFALRGCVCEGSGESAASGTDVQPGDGGVRGRALERAVTEPAPAILAFASRGGGRCDHYRAAAHRRAGTAFSRGDRMPG